MNIISRLSDSSTTGIHPFMGDYFPFVGEYFPFMGDYFPLKGNNSPLIGITFGRNFSH